MGNALLAAFNASSSFGGLCKAVWQCAHGMTASEICQTPTGGCGLVRSCLAETPSPARASPPMFRLADVVNRLGSPPCQHRPKIISETTMMTQLLGADGAVQLGCGTGFSLASALKVLRCTL